MADLDALIGERIRMLRQRHNVSQTELGKELGITFQQIQKYERGVNHVSAARLQAIAEIFGVPVTFFFEEGPSIAKTVQAAAREGKKKTRGLTELETECEALVRAFVKIERRSARAKVLALVRSLAAATVE